MTHDELIGRATRWLKNSKRCDCVLAEPQVANNYEFLDVIGWHAGKSIVIECKASLSDFYADRRKASGRNNRGLIHDGYYVSVVGHGGNNASIETYNKMRFKGKTQLEIWKEAMRIDHVNDKKAL